MTERIAIAFFVAGCCFVIFGGLVAAVTGPLDLDQGSWLAAYLVLVCGVAQCTIGKAQERLAALPVSARLGWSQLTCWNLGNAAVIAGTLTTAPIIVDIGGALLLFPLLTTIRAVRHSRQQILGWSYRAAIALLLISIPIGLALAHLRAT